MAFLKNMWTCPRCGRMFPNRNQSHACSSYTVDQFLKNRTKYALSLYHRFIEVLETFGDFEFTPARNHIGLRSGSGFAAITSIGPDYIEGHLLLPGKSASKKFSRVEDDTIHHFRIKKPDEIDEEFTGLMKKAYEAASGKKT